MAYATIATVRELPGLDDETAYPDALVTTAIARATELIEDYCGAWEPTTIVKRLAGSEKSFDLIATGIPHLRSVTSCTFDGDAQTVTGWEVDPLGDVYLDAASATKVRTILITVSAGQADTAPERLQWAARTLAASYAVNIDSSISDRALAVQSEFGQIQLAQAGGRTDRPTSLPEVNAVLNRYRSNLGGLVA